MTIQQINDYLEEEYQEQDLLVSEMSEVSREELKLKLSLEYHYYERTLLALTKPLCRIRLVCLASAMSFALIIVPTYSLALIS